MFMKLYPIYISSKYGGYMLYMVWDKLYILRPGDKKAVSVMITTEERITKKAKAEGFFEIEDGVYSHEHAQKIFEAYCADRKNILDFIFAILRDDGAIDNNQILDVMEPIDSFLRRYRAKQIICASLCYVGPYELKNIKRAIEIAESGNFKEAQGFFELVLKYEKTERRKNMCGINKEGFGELGEGTLIVIFTTKGDEFHGWIDACSEEALYLGTAFGGKEIPFSEISYYTVG